RRSPDTVPSARLPAATRVNVPLTFTSKAAAGSRTAVKKAAITSSGAGADGPGFVVDPVDVGVVGRMINATAISRTTTETPPPSRSLERGDCGIRRVPTPRWTPAPGAAAAAVGLATGVGSGLVAPNGRAALATGAEAAAGRVCKGVGGGVGARA